MPHGGHRFWWGLLKTNLPICTFKWRANPFHATDLMFSGGIKRDQWHEMGRYNFPGAVVISKGALKNFSPVCSSYEVLNLLYASCVSYKIHTCKVSHQCVLVSVSLENFSKHNDNAHSRKAFHQCVFWHVLSNNMIHIRTALYSFSPLCLQFQLQLLFCWLL